jgi:flagellar hook-associated protein 3 FlgL
MMTSNFKLHINRQANAMLTQQKRIASGKRVNQPSDDPDATARILAHRSRLERIDQYDHHIKRGKTRIEFTEQTLEQISDLVNRARQIAEEKKGANVTADERLAAADEVKGIYDQVMQLTNMRYENNYIFGGHQTGAEPFTRDASYNVTYSGDAGDYRMIIGEYSEVSLDADGSLYFHDAGNGGINIFDELRDLIVGLENPNLTLGGTQIDATIDPLFDGREQINLKRAELGPKIYQLDVSQQHWNNFKPKIADALAEEENADVTEAVLVLQSLEIAYESTLATAARMIEPGLMKYLS